MWRLLQMSCSWLDRLVLSEVEGLTTNGTIPRNINDPPFALSLSKGNTGPLQEALRKSWTGTPPPSAKGDRGGFDGNRRR